MIEPEEEIPPDIGKIAEYLAAEGRLPDLRKVPRKDHARLILKTFRAYQKEPKTDWPFP